MPLLQSLLLIMLIAHAGQGAESLDAKPPVITVKPHTISWGHSVSFDDTGLPTPDAWFMVELTIKADHEIILGCPRIELVSAVTDTGEKLIQMPGALDWSLASDDPVDTTTCRVLFKQPQQAAKSLAIQGKVTVAPPGSLRYVDLFPLSSYLGSWVEVQGLPGGSVHAFRQDNAVWLQFSPALSEVFHGMRYADPDGADVDVPDWTSSDDALPAYTNNVQLADGGRVSVGFFDLSKARLVPFNFPSLPLDGRPLDRSPAPDHCPKTAPTRSAVQDAPGSAKSHSSEKF